MLDERRLDLIEKGRQIGSSSFVEVGGVSHWLGVGIQKVNGKYVAHTSFIRKSDMVCEDFILDETIAFDLLSDAISFISDHVPREALPLNLGQEGIVASSTQCFDFLLSLKYVLARGDKPGKRRPAGGIEQLLDGHPHKTTPHINVMTPKGKKLDIFINVSSERWERGGSHVESVSASNPEGQGRKQEDLD
jgi:hypothetical protein